MKSIAFLLSLLPSTLGATIYLAGDSTMAAGGGGSGTDGTPYTYSQTQTYIYG